MPEIPTPEIESPAASNDIFSTLARLGGVLAGVTALVVAVQVLSSWYFGRGFLEGVGFPSQLINLRTSTDYFPVTTMEYSAAFLVCTGVGFFLPAGKPETHEKRRYILSYLLVACVAAFLIGGIFDVTWRILVYLIGAVAIVSPFLLGVTYNSAWTTPKDRYGATAITLMAILGVYTVWMFIWGRRFGLDLVQNAQPVGPSYQTGTAAYKARDYPLVTIRSKERLLLNSAPAVEGNSFTYSSTDSDFLRLILQDESNYYVIESVGGHAVPFAIRREIVQQIVFWPSGVSTSFPSFAPKSVSSKP